MSLYISPFRYVPSALDLDDGADNKGRVDATAEISKLEKKQVLAEQNKAKIVKTIQQPGYEKTAKDEVRQQNQERVSYAFAIEHNADNQMDKFDAEIESLTLAMDRFRALM